MQLPIVHLNGTSHRELTEGYEAAYLAAKDAMSALERIEFNARDYYPAGPDAWVKAREERVEIAQKLRDVKEYLAAHLNHLATLKR